MCNYSLNRVCEDYFLRSTSGTIFFDMDLFLPVHLRFRDRQLISYSQQGLIQIYVFVVVTPLNVSSLQS